MSYQCLRIHQFFALPRYPPFKGLLRETTVEKYRAQSALFIPSQQFPFARIATVNSFRVPIISSFKVRSSDNAIYKPARGKSVANLPRNLYSKNIPRTHTRSANSGMTSISDDDSLVAACPLRTKKKKGGEVL